MDKKKALQEIQNITLTNELSAQEVYDFLIADKSSVTAAEAKSTLLTRVLAYLGGVFLLGGIIAYTSMFWENMSPFFRVFIALGSGFALFLMAILSESNKNLTKLITPIHILAILLQGAGLLIFLSEYYEPSGRWQEPMLFVSGVLLLQQLFTFFAIKRTVLLFNAIACCFFVLGSIFNIIHIDENIAFSLIGIGYVAASFYLDKTEFNKITPFWYFVGSCCALIALFDLLEEQNIDVLFLLPSCFLVYLSTLAHSRTLLFVSIVSIFLFLGYFTFTYFADSIGWPLSLIIMGLVLFALSSVGFKLSKKL
ncbi:DUF2157 domain-containing protein [Candidatus Berkiella cookevillensis]|uniref:DUF2157 domain-containing protein n=1 Tax=Candidatus Berkiella cookevillensis TaxID=437022 RepID=A0A0Q9YH15_9GAMM|nr:DUF2157 domain-containing protein [Candidatus Berkiella cookevillensis]MCS5708520.1 DUF2157 domain-containing protein [Candidatus Berkiella cookevillensis]